jgi:hypothetical protein
MIATNWLAAYVRLFRLERMLLSRPGDGATVRWPHAGRTREIGAALLDRAVRRRRWKLSEIRRVELMALRRQDVDVDAAVIRIERSSDVDMPLGTRRLLVQAA